MSEPLWLVTFAYYSEQADVYVVAAPDADIARQRVAEVAADGVGKDGHWVSRAVLERAEVAQIRDGLHLSLRAER